MNQTSKCSICGLDEDPDLAELAVDFPTLGFGNRCATCHERERAAEIAEARGHAEQQILAARQAMIAEVIPPAIARTSLTHPAFNAGLWTKIETWDPSSRRWLGLVGAPGTGKTRCTGLLVKRLILEGRHVMWTTAVDLQDLVDASMSGERQIKADALKTISRMKVADILVLDDLGKNTWSTPFERHLFAIIDHRFSYDRPVLWTANTSLKDLFQSGEISKERAGPIIGRLHQISKIEAS